MKYLRGNLPLKSSFSLLTGFISFFLIKVSFSDSNSGSCHRFPSAMAWAQEGGHLIHSVKLSFGGYKIFQ